MSVFVDTAWIKYVHLSFSLLLRRIVEYTDLYSVIQVSNPSTRPIMGKTEIVCKPQHFAICPDGRKSSLAFCGASKCVTSFVVMQLPWIRSTFGTSCRDWRCTRGAFRISKASLIRLIASRSSFNDLPQLQRNVPSNTQ